MTVKKLVIIAVIVLVLFLIVQNWSKIKTVFAGSNNGGVVDPSTVPLNESQATINALQLQLAELTANSVNTNDPATTVTAIDINKTIQILKIQQTAGIVIPNNWMTWLKGLSLADLTLIASMDKATLTAGWYALKSKTSPTKTAEFGGNEFVSTAFFAGGVFF